MSVFVITEGEYSDYRISGIFSTRALAESAHPFFQKPNEIEEWELDALVPPPDRFPFSVIMEFDGTAKAERSFVTSIRASAFPVFASIGRKPAYRFYMWASDEAHAIKIANERRVQMIATNNWKV